MKKVATHYVGSWSCSKWTEGDDNDDEEKDQEGGGSNTSLGFGSKD